jgi:small conductance mechanosensitive channel
MDNNAHYIELFIVYAKNIVVSLAVVIGGWWGSQWVSELVRGRVLAIGRDETLAKVLTKVTRIALLVLTAIIVLSQFGVQTASLVALLGAAGLAIGLALQGMLSNVAAGVMLLILRPFKIGDVVDIDGIIGQVKEIGLFITQVNAPDNIAILVPNNRIWGAPIKNLSSNETRRLDLVFSISYEDDLNRALALIKEIVLVDSRVLKSPEAAFVVGSLGTNGVDLFIRPWVKAADYWDVRFDLTKLIKEAFDKEGITIPYPQQVVRQINISE